MEGRPRQAQRLASGKSPVAKPVAELLRLIAEKGLAAHISREEGNHDMKGMGGHRSAVGPIPDEWFENDTIPGFGKEWAPDGFDEEMLADILALKAKPLSPSEGPQERPSPPVQSTPALPASSTKERFAPSR